VLAYPFAVCGEPLPTPAPTPQISDDAGEAERKRQDDQVIEINRLLAEMAAKLKVQLPAKEAGR
jgi:hypothetical protein